MQQLASPPLDPVPAGRVATLNSDDLPEVVSLLEAAANRAVQLGWPAWTARELSRDALKFAVERGELFGWLSDSDILGCCILQSEDRVHWPDDEPGEALYLHKLAVEPSATGQGIGRALIAFACGMARRRRIPMLRLDTMPHSPLVAYYERYGFHADATGPVLLGDRRLIRMERPIDLNSSPPGDEAGSVNEMGPWSEMRQWAAKRAR